MRGDAVRFIGSRSDVSRWRRWWAGLLLGLVASGCGGKASTKNGMPAPSASSPVVDPFADVPSFEVELASEIALTAEFAPEAISLRDELLELHDLDGVRIFSKAGEQQSAGTRRARGSDSYFTQDGERVTELVFDQGLTWSGPFEPGGVLLEGARSATGLGIGHARELCEGCIYVADGPANLVAEYIDPGGRRLRTLQLPDTDPEGLAVAKSGSVYVADSERSRLLRVDPKLTRVEGIADLPGAQGKHPSGLAFDATGELYVCFRDWNTILVLGLPDED